MQTKPVSFGKRGAVSPAARTAATAGRSPVSPGRSAVELSASGVPISDLAKSLNLGSVAAPVEDDARETGLVPKSWRAGILAGLAVSCMKAGFVILNAKNARPEVAGLMQIAGVDEAKALPLLLMGSLWSGAESAAGTILMAHAVLRRLNITSVIAYGFGGGIVAAALTGLAFQLGLDDVANGWPIEIATGVGAGVFYRLFAGARGK